MGAEDLLAALDSLEWIEHVFIGKAKKPSILTDQGFLRSALRVARKLTSQVGLATDSPEFVQQVKAATDIDWLGASDRERANAIGELSNLIEGLPSKFLPGVKAALKTETRAVVQDTKRAVKEKYTRLQIDPVLTQRDERAIDALSTSSSIFFAPEYERQAVNFRARAQKTIADGLAKGYGRREIAADLRAEFRETAISEAYFEVAAANLVGRARSFSSLASYAEGGVEKHEWISLIDSRSTNLCTQLNGRLFSVTAALGAFEKLEDSKSLEAVKQVSPLLDGNASAEEFIAAGGHSPPAHHACRSTTAPYFDD